MGEMGEMGKVEEVARAIAKRNGDEYDNIPLDKADWKSANGMFGGIFRDLNQPTQVDYDEMAPAAIEAMRVPTEAMIDAGTAARWQSAVRDANSIREIWNAG